MSYPKSGKPLDVSLRDQPAEHKAGLANLRVLVQQWVDQGVTSAGQDAAIRMAIANPLPPDAELEYDALAMLLYNWHHAKVLTAGQSEQVAEAYHRPCFHAA